MRLSALKHLVESVHSLARSERICVLGSSSLLASFPELGEDGGPLELTYDADLLVEPCDEKLATMLHEAVGEGSLFAERHGYHADLLRPEITETLSPGWDERWVVLEAEFPAHALAPVDLAVVKLRTGRAKDLGLVEALVDGGKVTANELRGRLDNTPMDEKEVVTVYQRLEKILIKNS